jgi:DNA-binding NarL/FixJ family response regulator
MPARILLVDDHESVRRGVRTLFANNDSFEICGEAQNGTDAVRMVADLSPDVVILDLTMPGLTGFQTAAQIRQIAPSIKIIFFTIHDIPSSAWWVGADACVSKASTLEELTSAVNRVLQSRGKFQP